MTEGIEMVEEKNMETVQVLLSSYNGEKYIREQIDSIIHQKGVNVKILVRDDGSKDNTISILEEYEKSNVLTLVLGNNLGCSQSFYELIKLASGADYYALCDQDDVWDEDKLFIAINTIKRVSNKYVLYSSNTRLVDEEKKFIKNEDLNPCTTLGSAIIKNYVTGCTAVFNHCLLEKLQEYQPSSHIKCHDWWINLVTLALDGVSIYDTSPHISYRQHASNVTGASINLLSKWKSRWKRFKKEEYHRDRYAREILAHFHSITEENRRILQLIGNYKKNKLKIIICPTLSSESFIDTLLFKLLILLAKA